MDLRIATEFTGSSIFESFRDVRTAISRGKKLKGWRREKKIALIESQNPTWQDLSARFFENYAQIADDGETKSRSLTPQKARGFGMTGSSG